MGPSIFYGPHGPFLLDFKFIGPLIISIYIFFIYPSSVLVRGSEYNLRSLHQIDKFVSDKRN
jgi:hypothetical protein